MTIMVKLRPCSLCVTFEYVYNIAHLFTGIPFQVYVVSNEFCIIIIVNIPIEIVRINIVSIIEWDKLNIIYTLFIYCDV